jgi:hypothetical protein
MYIIQKCTFNQGCQMVYFQPKNFGKFQRALELKLLVHFMPIWYKLWPFGIFYI